MTMEDAGMKKKEYKKRVADMLKVYPSISYEIADQIKAATGLECRVTVPGHMQRGGAPNAYDRVLSSRLGTYGALLFSKGEFGQMVAIQDHNIVSVPLSEVAGKLKTVAVDSDIIVEARMLGISFGDR
jgi:6-phosphofructokinase 1